MRNISPSSFIHPTSEVKGKNITIGSHCYIGPRVYIDCDDFKLGDYARIHTGTTIHGSAHCHIGYNLWCGQYSIIDCHGGVTIGNNCGIGAQSQLWSHIKYGDVLEGCQFNENKPLIIGNDVWFVGHCIVSPITAHDKSMALAGSVITKDMNYNTMYCGVSQEMKRKPFGNPSAFGKVQQMSALIMKFHGNNTPPPNERLAAVTDYPKFLENGITYFNVTDRTYTKRNTPTEVEFMKWLLPEKAKFVPVGEN